MSPYGLSLLESAVVAVELVAKACTGPFAAGLAPVGFPADTRPLLAKSYTAPADPPAPPLAHDPPVREGRSEGDCAARSWVASEQWFSCVAIEYWFPRAVVAEQKALERKRASCSSRDGLGGYRSTAPAAAPTDSAPAVKRSEQREEERDEG